MGYVKLLSDFHAQHDLNSFEWLVTYLERFYFLVKIKYWRQGLSNQEAILVYTVEPVLRGHSKRRPKLVFKTNYRLMQVKSIAEHTAILSTIIQLSFVIKIFVIPPVRSI